MNSSNQIIYQQLLTQIENLWDEEFIHKLELGKYSRWAVTKLIPSEIMPMLAAIGQYGRFGVPCPDIDTEPMFCGKGLDAKQRIQIFLNDEQQQSLGFLCLIYWQPCYRKPPSEDNIKRNLRMLPEPIPLTIPFEFSENSPDFIENVSWAMDLTSSDLFGIIWHVGGFATRAISGIDVQGFNITSGKPTKGSINEYSPRSQEALICLLRVAQKQPTYYQLAGERFPLREYQQPTNINN